MASNNQRHAQEAAAHQQEIDVLKAKWAADDETARQAERDARLRQQQLNVEVKEFNRSAIWTLGIQWVSAFSACLQACRLACALSHLSHTCFACRKGQEIKVNGKLAPGLHGRQAQ